MAFECSFKDLSKSFKSPFEWHFKDLEKAFKDPLKTCERPLQGLKKAFKGIAKGSFKDLFKLHKKVFENVLFVELHRLGPFKGLFKCLSRPCKRHLKDFWRPLKGLLKDVWRLFKGFYFWLFLDFQETLTCGLSASLGKSHRLHSTCIRTNPSFVSDLTVVFLSCLMHGTIDRLMMMKMIPRWGT